MLGLGIGRPPGLAAVGGARTCGVAIVYHEICGLVDEDILLDTGILNFDPD
jgi:hypothetical protein